VAWEGAAPARAILGLQIRSILDLESNSSRRQTPDPRYAGPDAQGNITSYGFITADCVCSPGHDLFSFRDASGRTLAHNYDFDGRMTQRTDSAGVIGFAYTARGDLVQRTDANGNTIQFEYDAAGRLIHKIFPDGTEARFTYDANGNLTGAFNANTSIALTYDDLNRVTSTVDSRFEQRIQYEYNRNGLRTRLTDSDGGVTAYTYDGNSRLTSVTTPSGAARFSYDAPNRRVGMTYSNSSSATYQYDAASRLTKLAYSGTLPQLTYTYDKNGNPTAIADSAATHSYQYDELDRLTVATHPSAAAESYRYDGAGNRLASAADSGYAYDAAGRLLAAEAPPTATITTGSEPLLLSETVPRGGHFACFEPAGPIR
jgi:YD repeat-containing protein